jgi:cytochrome d ubiquinol oxidase subunit II
VFVGLFVTHGANFLRLKTDGEIAARAGRAAFTSWIAATLLTGAFVAWTFFATDLLTKPGVNGLIPAVLAALALLLGGLFIRTDKNGWAFVMVGLTVIFATAMVFAGLFPRILVSTLNPAWSLTIYNAASTPYTLKVMTIVAAIFIPIVLAYQAWTYWIFRKRVTGDPQKLVY